MLGAAECRTTDALTIGKIFDLFLEALSRLRRNGAGTVDMLTSLWPGLMPRVLLVVRKIARCMESEEVRCCWGFPPCEKGLHSSAVTRHEGAAAMEAL